MSRIYLDHASATPVAKEVVDAMVPYWSETFGNPSSIHKDGIQSHKVVARARKSIADSLGVHSDEIIFTGSATESCNLALMGTVHAWKKNHPGEIAHIIVSEIEHEAVLGAAKLLEGEGVQVSYLPVDGHGVVLLDTLASIITKNTVVISVMLANNEIGTIQPVSSVAKIIRTWKKDVRGVTRDTSISGDQIYPLLHSDACQATNYLPIKIPALGVDLLTINAAKIYGPKGIALLVSLRPVPILPIVVGGAHEAGRRAGTENVPFIVGFAEALKLTERVRDNESTRLSALRDNIVGELKKNPAIVLNGSLSARLPNNIHFSIRGADHEFLALTLDAKGISVSTKSACNEQDAEYSHVLGALVRAGHNTESNGIRVTMGRSSTANDITALLRVVSVLFPSEIVTPL